MLLSVGADRKLVEFWLSLKTSSHTRRAYAFEASRFLDFVKTPLLPSRSPICITHGEAGRFPRSN